VTLDPEPATVLDGPDAVRAAVGTELGESDWLIVSADRIAEYAASTGDRDTPTGLVPPYLLLACSNLFLPQIVRVDGFAMGVNYGVDTVRFPTEVTAGSSVRGRATLVAVDELPTGLQTLMRITIETIDGRAACVIDSLSRWFP
jgi:acyl dehydratase